jgi:hypothetical protein
MGYLNAQKSCLKKRYILWAKYGDFILVIFSVLKFSGILLKLTHGD